MKSFYRYWMASKKVLRHFPIDRNYIFNYICNKISILGTTKKEQAKESNTMSLNVMIFIALEN